MKKSYLSIGIPYESLNADKILLPEIASKFPGALWVSKLDEIIDHDLFEIHTSDVILEMIQCSRISPNDVYLFCDETIEISSYKLLELGCKPFILSSFESPIVSRKFYRIINKYTKVFKHKVLFKGCFNNAMNDSFETLYFPSYLVNNNVGTYNPTLKLSRVALVMSNIYFEPVGGFFKKFVYKAKNSFVFNKNRFSKYHRKIQLYNERFAAICYFSNLNKLDIFGRGWDSLNNLPINVQNSLEGTTAIATVNLIPLGKKVDKIAEYKYSLCIENCAFPGYVTEKIIDAIVAKTLPIYLGAPDIEDFIPSNCFINWRKFNSINEISDYLEALSESDYIKYLENGEIFLKSEAGYNFSYESYANKINQMLINERS